jgi:hypothetical protein
MTHHLPTEEEDLGFQEGRAVALYLETLPCRNGTAVCHIVCPDCIAEAVNIVHETFARSESVKREPRPRIVLKKWPTEII